MEERFSLSDFQKKYQHFLQYSPDTEEYRETFFAIFRMFLPAFHFNRHIPFSSFEKDKIINIEPEELIIPLHKIYGDSWIFSDDFTEGRPKSDRMACLITMTPASNYPTIWGMKLSNGYAFTNDGNHRIYTAYLLGWDTIRITCDQLYQGKWDELIAHPHAAISSSSQ